MNQIKIGSFIISPLIKTLLIVAVVKIVGCSATLLDHPTLPSMALERYKNTIVRIMSTDQDGTITGTGFLFRQDAFHDYIMTNNHVIKDGESFVNEERLTLVKRHPTWDICIVKRARTGNDIFLLSTIYPPIGAEVVIVSRPPHADLLFTKGYISSERGLINGPVLPGSSGSPVLYQGKVIGVVFAQTSNKGITIFLPTFLFHPVEQ